MVTHGAGDVLHRRRSQGWSSLLHGWLGVARVKYVAEGSWRHAQCIIAASTSWFAEHRYTMQEVYEHGNALLSTGFPLQQREAEVNLGGQPSKRGQLDVVRVKECP